MFQVIEGCLYFGGPISLVVFLSKGKVGVGHGGVVWDEAVVEVGKAQEGLYFLDFGRSGPAGNSIKFD